LRGVSATLLLIAIAGTSLVNCGKKSEQAGPPGQVIAHIGKEDVTAQELENEFGWASITPDKRDDETIKRVLGDLVLRKYLAQKAVEAELDRQPAVLLNILRSREQALANAYLGRDVATKASAIGKTEIQNYINSQPWKFANRKIYTVEQITIPLTPEAQAAVDAAKPLKSLDEIDQKLNELKILHNRSMGIMSSGEFSKQVLEQVEGKKNTDQFYVQTPTSGVFFKVRGEETRPLAGEAAEQIARQALVANLIRSEANTQALAAAADSEVKYEEPYARIMGKEKPADSKASEAK
jgi:EpsD family peptidyl-prolyl cis-trans isomerase